MQVILLAAGQSTRLQPIHDKNLLTFAGKTLIEHRIAALKKAKIRDIVVVGNKENMQGLEEALCDYKNILIVEQKDMKGGQAAGVLAGAKAVTHKNIIVMSANDVFDFNEFDKIIAEAKKAEDGLIVGKRVNEYFPGGYISMDKKGYMTEIIEKPGEGNEPSNLINLIFHVYNDFPTFIKQLENTKGKAEGKYEKALDTCLKKGKAKMSVYKYKGFWQPIKYPWHILDLMNLFLVQQEPKISKKADISERAIINGNVIIEEGVRVFDNAVIQGPAYIGKNTIIANNALVRGSMIGENCVVGFATEVARSYLNHHIWMHTNYIGDSIVDNNVSFGAGTVTGNLRFDEENVKVKIKTDRVDTGTHKFGAIIGSGVRFGINSSTSPGVKIGKDTFVGAGVLVEKDVDGGKMVLLEQKVKVVDNKKKVDVKRR